MESTMATKNFDDTSCCGICWQKYSKEVMAPVTIRCGHTFCHRCLTMLTRGKSSIHCATCRSKIFVSPNQMAKNYQLMDVLKVLGQLQEDPMLPPEPEALQEPTQNENQLSRMPTSEPPANAQQNPSLIEPPNPQVMATIDELVTSIREMMEPLYGAFNELHEIARDFTGDIQAFIRRLEQLNSILNDFIRHPAYTAARRIQHQQGPRNEHASMYNPVRAHRHRHRHRDETVGERDHPRNVILHMLMAEGDEDIVDELRLQAIIMEHIGHAAGGDVGNNVQPDYADQLNGIEDVAMEGNQPQNGDEDEGLETASEIRTDSEEDIDDEEMDEEMDDEMFENGDFIEDW